jgi:hypothetical protein
MEYYTLCGHPFYAGVCFYAVSENEVNFIDKSVYVMIIWFYIFE